MDAEPAAKKPSQSTSKWEDTVSEYIANTNECVQIKLLTGPQDFKRELATNNVENKHKNVSEEGSESSSQQLLSFYPEISCQVK